MKLKISESTHNFIQDLKQFSSGKLKHPEGISLLYEVTVNTKQEKLFEEIIFTAKYLNGLGKILHSSPERSRRATKPIDENALGKIKTEFKDNLQKLTSQIKSLLKDTSDNDKSEFEKKFFSLTRESLVNLTNLIYDLSWVKKWWNREK